jgi:uroporphyrinogen decarboxylase
LVDYCKNVVQYDSVGVVTVNDDWGFNTQTMLSPEQMRQYVFPWTKKIVDAAHDANVPVILHSCGNLEMVFEDVLKLGVDAKHSFEDKILPIEDAYEKWHDRIPLMGGFDMDYMCRSSEDEIRKRTAAMMERTKGRGGWAIGTGNSVPEYVPVENYLAMTRAALDADKA